VEWLLATHTAKVFLIPRPWIDHPYREEEIALLEEELLPAMAVFLARVDAIDRAIEADQELELKSPPGPLRARWVDQACGGGDGGFRSCSTCRSRPFTL